MQAIVLAAGLGIRMGPLTATRPKPMLPVAGKPILQHIMDRCVSVGIRDFVFVVGHESQKIVDYFDRFTGVDITYVYQSDLSGTTGALLSAEEYAFDQLVVINGDVITDIAPVTKASSPAIGVTKSRPFIDCDYVHSSDGVVNRVGQGESNWLNAGVYRFDRDVFNSLKTSDLLSVLVGSSPVELDEWFHLSTPQDLLFANSSLLTTSDISPSAKILPGAYIEGPVYIGDGSVIGPNCCIRPFTSIGNNCRIGQSVEIKNSIIMSGTKIPHLSYVGDSVIGENCNLAGGTIIANLRHDNKRPKFGAVFGDNVKTTINTSIMPGTIIPCRSVV